MKPAPPPTRGSTIFDGQKRKRCNGSPAHAGIDLEFLGLDARRTGLPRPRGDRPALESIRIALSRAPPPTRGSTRRPAFRTCRSRGSPAHAGIDRRSENPLTLQSRLPRPRGDRPLFLRLALHAGEAPPPTRGSTRILGHRYTAKAGSPAHAGIDPPRGRGSCDPFGLPRPRGDRPNLARCRWPAALAPPPTRGSTLAFDRLNISAFGSPAHAGIDPVVTFALIRAGRLPRPRGDRP